MAGRQVMNIAKSGVLQRLAVVELALGVNKITAEGYGYSSGPSGYGSYGGNYSGGYSSPSGYGSSGYGSPSGYGRNYAGQGYAPSYGQSYGQNYGQGYSQGGQGYGQGYGNY